MPAGTISYNTFASAGIETSEYYSHDIRVLRPSRGQTTSSQWRYTKAAGTSSDVSFDFSLETSDPTPSADDIVSLGATWSYLDDGTDQGTAWREPDFDDSGWESGPPQLGFGEDDEATVITRGPGGSTTWTTFYFRHDFNVESAGVGGFGNLSAARRRRDHLSQRHGDRPVEHARRRRRLPDVCTGRGRRWKQNLHRLHGCPRPRLVDGDNVLAVEGPPGQRDEFRSELRLVPGNRRHRQRYRHVGGDLVIPR